MNKDKINQLNQGFNTAFIDYTAASNLAYRPQFVSNNYKEGRKVISSIEDDYPHFHLSMDCFICKIKSGDLVLKEHEAVKWLTKENLDSVDWLPADLSLVEKIRNEI